MFLEQSSLDDYLFEEANSYRTYNLYTEGFFKSYEECNKFIYKLLNNITDVVYINLSEDEKPIFHSDTIRFNHMMTGQDYIMSDFEKDFVVTFKKQYNQNNNLTHLDLRSIDVSNVSIICFNEII